MTEIGVYILGATALAILAAAGIFMTDLNVVFCAVLSSGAAYVAQIGAYHTASGTGGRWSLWLNAIAMLAALLAWVYGAYLLL